MPQLLGWRITLWYFSPEIIDNHWLEFSAKHRSSKESATCRFTVDDRVRTGVSFVFVGVPFRTEDDVLDGLAISAYREFKTLRDSQQHEARS